MAKEKEKKFDFEQSLKRLEEIVEKLENEELALDESLKLFEEGKRLGEHCLKYLTEMEKKIQLISEREDGSVETQDFSPPAAEKTPE